MRWSSVGTRHTGVGGWFIKTDKNSIEEWELSCRQVGARSWWTDVLIWPVDNIRRARISFVNR